MIPTPEPGKALVVDNLDVIIAGVPIVKAVSLSVDEGEFLAVLGPSGAGKSTLLNAIAGRVKPSGGRISIFGVETSGHRPQDIPASTVFQHHALFPHLNVEENISFGLRSRGYSKPAAHRKVMELLEVFHLVGFEKRLVGELSGGESQRVATARALAVEPRLLLMDEPLAALDRVVRERLQRELKRILHELRITTLHVTHDQSEAMGMGDRIAVVRDGGICQVGSPVDVYVNPASVFVATFVGGASLLDGVAARAGGRLIARCGQVELLIRGDLRPGPVTVILRAEDLKLTDEIRYGEPKIAGKVKAVDYLGGRTRYEIAAGGVGARNDKIAVVAVGSPRAMPGQNVYVGFGEKPLALPKQECRLNRSIPPA
jgi:ABC-type Fe3+/spermidine/putrescine transport system ATPase subunit